MSFLAVGHVARDELPDGTWRLGGSALYGAATAARLGLATRLVTRVGPHERDELERACAALGVALDALPSLTTTTFAFRFDGGRRSLRLRSRARAITAADVPADARGASATLLGSIAHEIGPDLFAGEGVRVLAAQGLVRAWDADGTVRPVAWPDALERIAGLGAVVLSEEDLAGDDAAIREWSRVAPVVLTLADRGARTYEGGRPGEGVAPYRPARLVDATGAGDAFAAALAVALAEGRDLRSAVAFANAAASFCVEEIGTSGLASREDVERRLSGLR
jgi:sugar/nucleoside kinase (ribokinase family)